MSWHSTQSVDEFLEAAGGFLRSRPVENTLFLTIARAVKLRGEQAFGPDAPIFGWLAGGDGAFLQTPPHPLVLSAMPAGRVPELAELLAKRPLPAVNGLTADAEAFAARWRELTGASVEVGMRTRLFRLATLLPPPPPPGVARVAGPAHRDLLIDWMTAFQGDVHGAVRVDQATVVDDKMSHGGLMLWEVDGRAVSMAGITRAEAGAVRVAPVYTPPELRGHGYGAAVTAAVTQAALDAGAEDVVLFTDVTNPTSNALYERLGYRPIQDRTVLEFKS
jgi:RimJ/RimL family protein N-acetyltransferase